jgi:hypothetical protein
MANGADWKQYSFPISSFDTDGHDITGINFLHGRRTQGNLGLQLMSGDQIGPPLQFHVQIPR